MERLHRVLAHFLPAAAAAEGRGRPDHRQSVSVSYVSSATGQVDYLSRPSTAQLKYSIQLADIEEAANRLKNVAHLTPIHTSNAINQIAGLELFFKCENFQKVGAFKFRGAYNAVQKALSECSNKSNLTFVTHSSGNHAAALAHAASLCHCRSIIVMPSNSPKVKVEAVKGYGGQIRFCEPNQAAREKMANDALQECQGILIPPYDFPHVMAGQGTIALEILQQVKQLDGLIVPVGGGGMLSGIVMAAKSINPNIHIWAAEPLIASDCFESIQQSKLIPLPKPTNTVADGLRTSLGEHNWPIIRDLVSGVIVVSEEEIIKAMRLIWERMKLIIEPSAAVGLAAALSSQFTTLQPKPDGKFRDNNPAVLNMKEYIHKPVKRVAIVLCGGNVDLDTLPWATK